MTCISGECESSACDSLKYVGLVLFVGLYFSRWNVLKYSANVRS